MVKHNTVSWNRLDKIIFRTEKAVSRIISELKNSREELPDPEEMIAAATEHLQKENDILKQHQVPGRIIISENRYYCPCCNKQIADKLLEHYHIKFCPECGKKIVLSIPYPYI